MGFRKHVEEQKAEEFNNLILEEKKVNIKGTASKEADKMLKMSEKDFDKAGDAAFGKLIEFAKKHKVEKKILDKLNKKMGGKYTSLEQWRKDLKSNKVNEGFSNFIAKGNAIKTGAMTTVLGLLTYLGGVMTAAGGAAAITLASTSAGASTAAGATILGAFAALGGAAAASFGSILIFITIITRVVIYITKKTDKESTQKE